MFVVRGSSFAVRCSLCVVRRLVQGVVCCVAACCEFIVVSNLSLLVRCLLLAACWLTLWAVVVRCWPLFTVRCVLLVGCG